MAILWIAGAFVVGILVGYIARTIIGNLVSAGEKKSKTLVG